MRVVKCNVRSYNMYEPRPGGTVAARFLGKKEVEGPIPSLGSTAVDAHKMCLAEFSPGYPSGQRGQTVNLLAIAYVGSNPTPGTNECNSPLQGCIFSLVRPHFFC